MKALAAVLLLASLSPCWSQSARHQPLGALNTPTRELFADSMRIAANFWDPATNFLRNPTPTEAGQPSVRHTVRESGWYALGLLYRDAPGDRTQAAAILDAVLKQQYTTPGVRWYGTYRRSPEEPLPVEPAVPFGAYDPNWREFIGTTFEIILIEFPTRIPPELAGRMYAAIDRSLEGELAEKRLVPSYSNIALMYGALWDFASAHNQRADWRKQSADWVESTQAVFAKFNAFTEYNSPTYYGVDLYGLALWRNYGSTPRMRSLGARMEATLWTDIASFYQPQLRNISGPYDRSYGMDMERYVAVTGVWMRSALDAASAPLPPIAATTDHLGDVWFAPSIAILGTRIPPEALARMRTFQGPHLVRRQITEDRTATAWIGGKVIFGGEATSHTKDAGPGSQFHPATIQWRTPSGHVGWVRLTLATKVDVTADKHGLTITGAGPLEFRLHAAGLQPAAITPSAWSLPGLHGAITSNATGFSMKEDKDGIDLSYPQATTMRIEIAKP